MSYHSVISRKTPKNNQSYTERGLQGMKKKAVKLLIAIAASLTFMGCHEKTAGQNTIKTVENQFILDNVEIYHTKTQKDFDKLTEILATRRGKIIIEIVEGIVLDNAGNGKDIITDCSKTGGGYYIKYDSDRFSKGDKVQSIFIYNPDNNSFDDIIYRTDTLIEQKRNNFLRK